MAELPNDAHPEDWLGKRQASAYTGVSRSTIDERRRRGFFEEDEWGRTGPGGHVRYKRRALDRMMRHYGPGGQTLLVTKLTAAAVSAFVLFAVGCDVGHVASKCRHGMEHRPVAEMRQR